MSTHCVPLNLTINPVTVDHSTLKKQYQTSIPLKLLNSDIITIFQKYSIKINYAESFYSPPNYTQPIHTDVAGGDYVKLNFVYDGFGSNMHWYKVKEGMTTNNINVTPDSGTPYIPWDPSTVELVESNPLAYPSLVQVGCPHNVTTKDKHRLCISLFLIDVTTFKRITFDIAKNRLAEYLIGAT